MTVIRAHELRLDDQVPVGFVSRFGQNAAVNAFATAENERYVSSYCIVGVTAGVRAGIEDSSWSLYCNW